MRQICVMMTIGVVLGTVVAATAIAKATRPEDNQRQIPERTISSYIQARNDRIPKEFADLIAAEIQAASKKHQVPEALMVGIIEKESLFNPYAVSSERARGLMQILVGQVEIDPKQAHDIAYNLDIGATILKEKIKAKGGSITQALAAYSGNATNYGDGVMTNVGRFILYCQ